MLNFVFIQNFVSAKSKTFKNSGCNLKKWMVVVRNKRLVQFCLNRLSSKPTTWSNTLKQFVGLAVKRLIATRFGHSFETKWCKVLLAMYVCPIFAFMSGNMLCLLQASQVLRNNHNVRFLFLVNSFGWYLVHFCILFSSCSWKDRPRNPKFGGTNF